MKIDIRMPRTVEGEPMWNDVEIPAIPRTGEHLSSDRDGYSGTVQNVSYWQDETGEWTIEIYIK